MVVVSPWLLVALVASVVAFYASARGLQEGEAVPVIAATAPPRTSSASRGGILVFGDPMPADALGIAVQCAAFVMVLVAALSPPRPYARPPRPHRCSGFRQQRAAGRGAP